MANAGNPRCVKCHGRGGVFRSGRWHRCECMRITRAQVAAYRRLGEVGGAKWKPLDGEQQ